MKFYHTFFNYIQLLGSAYSFHKDNFLLRSMRLLRNTKVNLIYMLEDKTNHILETY
jgi:hypothetical protein